MKTKIREIVTLLLAITILLSGCASDVKVGELRTESHSVEVDDAESVRVDVNVGAAELKVSGGADKLLESDFTYNVDKMKPEVTYTNGTLTIQHADVKGPYSFAGITGYRNEWDLRLTDAVPMDLSVDIGAGTSELKLAGLSLTNLNVTLGAGDCTVDLSGNWARDLPVTIDTGAANITLRLPKDLGVRVQVDAGASMVIAPDLKKDGSVYINSAYGASEVTLQINMEAGIGQIFLEIDE